MKRNRLSALLLAFVLLFTLAACKTADEPPTTDTPTAAPSQPVETSAQPDPAPTGEVPPTEDQPTDAPTETPAPEGTAVSLAVISGPTGIGAAKLLSDSDKGETANRYTYRIATDNSEVVAGLTTGEIDIAAVASNLAVNLYNKTDGGVKIIALGTLGVLHILESGGKSEVTELEDLAGKTLWCAGQGANPEYVIRYLLAANGIDPEHDVQLVFADPAEITQKLMTGEAEVAMLPVPAATAAIAKSEGKVRGAIDLTEAWDELETGSRLIMTAVVARTQFLNENPEAVALFLQEYAASIDYALTNPAEAAPLVAGYGIAPSEGIAKQAIPQCHLTFISGSDMAPAISGYYEILWQADPASIGGALPDDGIFYVP